jgi:hypothetical protein
MLGFMNETIFMADPYWRRPQQSVWNDTLHSPDGADSRATVNVYEATEPKPIGAPFNTTNSCGLVQKAQPSEIIDAFGVKEYSQLMSRSGRGKDLLVVVKPGPAAEIAEHDSPPCHKDDTR